MVSSMNGRSGFPDRREADPSRMQARMDEELRSDPVEPPRDDATREEAYEAYVAARSTGSRACRVGGRGAGTGRGSPPEHRRPGRSGRER